MLNLSDNLQIEDFMPCRFYGEDSKITSWIFEDVAYVAKPAFEGIFHFIDEMRALDDNRLIGIQYWGPPPANLRNNVKLDK